MNYKIQLVAHNLQRYDTVGDYWRSNPQLIEMRISDFSEAVGAQEGTRLSREEVTLAEKYEFLVMIHELIEAFLCHQAGIAFEEIDSFDMKFTGDGEPGEAEECPYKTQHKVATLFEEKLAAILGVDWTTYENAIQKLSSKNDAVAEQEKEG